MYKMNNILKEILTENLGTPKAIILAGAPGAGKGYVLRGLDLGGLKTMNVDDQYIANLKAANVSLDLKNATPEDRSLAAKAMATSNKSFKQDVQDTIAAKEFDNCKPEFITFLRSKLKNYKIHLEHLHESLLFYTCEKRYTIFCNFVCNIFIFH